MFYKQPDIDQIKIFCSLVENNNNMTKTADSLSTSISAVSLKMKALRNHLGYDLFIYEDRRITGLTSKGKEFYIQAVDIVNKFNKAFSSDTEVKEIKVKRSCIKKFINSSFVNFLIKQLNKMLLKITWKRVLVASAIIACITYAYLTSINYFFDRDLKKLASPFLRQIIGDGDHRSPENKPCFHEGRQAHIAVYDVLINLSKKSNYKNIIASSVTVGKNPSILFKMTGNEKEDIVFKDQKYIACDTDVSYEDLVTMFNKMKTLLSVNNKYFEYSFHYNAIDKNCFRCDKISKNIEPYSTNFVVRKINKPEDTSGVEFWIISYRRYYYFMTLTNLVPNSINEYKENHIIWKKMTLSQLMRYDNGLYWKLIKENNINID